MKKLRNIQAQFREIATDLNQLLEEKLANELAEGTNPSPPIEGKPRVRFEEDAELTRTLTHRCPKEMKWLGLTKYIQGLDIPTGFEGAEEWMDAQANNETFRSIQSFVSKKSNDSDDTLNDFFSEALRQEPELAEEDLDINRAWATLTTES